MTDRAAFLAKHARHITRDPVFGCWIWDRVDRDGYGTSYAGGRGPRQAHVEVYRAFVGDPPAEHVLDHWCRRRNCVRPEHLEAVTHAENDRRRVWRYRARMTTCPRGHSLALNILTPSESPNRGGGRLCRTCMGPEKDE